MRSNISCHSVVSACLGLMLLGVASCEKMNIVSQPADDGRGEQRPNVTVRVTSFEQVPFSPGTRAEVADACSRLVFILYDSEGKKVKHVSQKQGDESFGTASFAVPEGRYLAVAVGHSSGGNPSMANPLKLQFTNSSGYSDTFMASDSVTVTDASTTLNLAMRRIVAKVRLMVDNPPKQGTTLVRINYKGGSGAFSALTGLGTVKSDQYTNVEVDGTEQQFEVYTIPHAERDTLNFTVMAHDASGLELTNDTILNVPVRVNHVTVCRGYLFYGNSARTRSTSFTVSLDDAWASEQLQKSHQAR